MFTSFRSQLTTKIEFHNTFFKTLITISHITPCGITEDRNVQENHLGAQLTPKMNLDQKSKVSYSL